MRATQIKHHTEIFPGALWSQRHVWRRATHLLPANACLLVVDVNNEKQTRLMRRIARAFQDKGQLVLIWLTPTKGRGSRSISVQEYSDNKSWRPHP